MNGTKKGMRDAYGEALAELGELNENIVVLDADFRITSYNVCYTKLLR